MLRRYHLLEESLKRELMLEAMKELGRRIWVNTHGNDKILHSPTFTFDLPRRNLSMLAKIDQEPAPQSSLLDREEEQEPLPIPSEIVVATPEQSQTEDEQPQEQVITDADMDYEVAEEASEKVEERETTTQWLRNGLRKLCWPCCRQKHVWNYMDRTKRLITTHVGLETAFELAIP